MFNKKKDWYSGSSSYKQINKLLRSKSKYIMISTPYIDNYYLKILGRISRKRKVMLVSSKASNKKIKKFMSNKIRKFSVMFFVVYLASLLGIWFMGLYLILQNAFVYIPLIFSIVISIVSKGTKLKVHIIGNEFVHEKLYITEKLAITGSANLTYAGTHKNIEHIEIIEDLEKIRGLRKHFEKLWNYDYI